MNKRVQRVEGSRFQGFSIENIESSSTLQAVIAREAKHPRLTVKEVPYA